MSRSVIVSVLVVLVIYAWFEIDSFHSRILSDINTHFETTPTSHLGNYKLVKQYYSDDNTIHYVATHTGVDKFYGNSRVIENIHLTIFFHNENTFRIKITDEDHERWEIPEEYPFIETKSENLIPAEHASCEIHIQGEPFSLWITRKSNGEVLFDMRRYQLVYSNYFIELTTDLPTADVYGFGERNYKFKLGPGTYTIWGRDDPMILEDGSGGANTYSHQPVGLFRDRSKNFFLTLMKNSNAMDVVIGKRNTLTYKMVGGIVDIVFFVGEKSPESVIVNYHKYLGNFTMMPFWSMGFHQSKWGYQTYGMMLDVVAQYIHNSIPLDVIWSDIDYMIDKEVFTIDQYRFPAQGMRELTTKYKKKWVPIVDPGIKASESMGPGSRVGLERNVFLKNNHGRNLIGSVWPGRTYFPDFFHPRAEAYWADMLNTIYSIIPMGGIWLDMNEIANFVDGEEQRWDLNEYDQIPYTPSQRPLKRKTVSLDAVHYGGTKEYDAHSLFAIQESAATHKFLKTKSKLPFILTRSASVGIGKYSAHWTGDNGAHWEYLRASIPSNFNFNMFGVPFVGSDICGFMDHTNADLCARWMQLGALYPFARNHHEDRTRSQEPWTFSAKNYGVSVVETSRIALQVRYSLLKWYYSLFIRTNGAGTIFRPLMFEFPQEEILHSDQYNDWEFLLGDSLLCTPQTSPSQLSVNAYFPKATWYEFFDGKKVISSDAANRVLKIVTPYNAAVPLFLRAGYIIHRQDTEKVLSTEDLNDEFEFVIALNQVDTSKYMEAQGSFMGVQTFTDDRIYDRCMQNDCMYRVKVIVPVDFEARNTLKMNFAAQESKPKFPLQDIGVKGLKIFGLPLESLNMADTPFNFAVCSKTTKFDGLVTISEPARTIITKSGTIMFTFAEAVRIQDGDKITIEFVN